MIDNLKSLLHNPPMLIGSVLLGGSGLMLIISASALTAALLFNPEIQLTAQKRGQPSHVINTQSIGSRNFFGFAKTEPELLTETLPETQLELILRGAFTAQDKQNAGAIIEDEQKIANHYAIGDELPGDAILKAIYANRVVLARNGMLETLYFPENEKSTAGVGSRKNTRAASNTVQAQDSRQATERRNAIRERIKQLRGRK